MSAAVQSSSAPTAGSGAMPEAEGHAPATSVAAIEDGLRTLADRKAAWLAVGIPRRVEMLREMRGRAADAAPALVQQACAVKGWRPGGDGEAEEWMAGVYPLLRNLRLLERSLREIARGNVPRLPEKAWVRPDGQVVAQVMPTDLGDRLLMPGYTAEIWMDPAVGLEDLRDTMAVAYQAKRRDATASGGKVALVLGAGNVSSIGPMDVLYKLFVEDEVVVLKTNPVNDYTGAFVEAAFAPLIDEGFLRVVYGGVETGKLLCEHPLVETIHITGSDKTHDAIVFGGGPEGAARKARGERRNPRTISSELGNVTPVIVVPGPWSAADVKRQGLNIATGLVNNAGFNCIAHRVILHHAGWERGGELIDAVRHTLVQTPTRRAYYPGASARFDAFREAHPDLETYGEAAAGELPWAFTGGLDPEATDDICFSTEAFCGLFGDAALPADDPAAFVREAVRFCNERVWGTLAAAIIVHPRSMADPAVGQAVEQAIADLRYGTIVVNHITGLGYALTSTTWGAFPGHPIEDIQSGRGVVHNTYMFDRPQKSVVRGPFKPFPPAPWMSGNPHGLLLGKRLAGYEAKPSLKSFLRVVRAGLKR